MPSVQVRDVPRQVVDALKRRAAGNRQSLQRYLFDLLAAEAAVADNAELLDEAATDAGGWLAEAGEAATALRQDRADRDGLSGQPER